MRMKVTRQSKRKDFFKENAQYYPKEKLNLKPDIKGIDVSPCHIV